MSARRYRDAELLFRGAVAESGRSKPRNDRFYTDALLALAACLVRDRSYGEALPLVRECVEIKEKTQGDDWTTDYTRSLLGEVLTGQKAYAEAEPLLLTARQALSDRRGTIPPFQRDAALRVATGRLVGLYEDWGKPEKAAEWRKKAAELLDPVFPRDAFAH